MFEQAELETLLLFLPTRRNRISCHQIHSQINRQIDTYDIDGQEVKYPRPDADKKNTDKQRNRWIHRPLHLRVKTGSLLCRFLFQWTLVPAADTSHLTTRPRNFSQWTLAWPSTHHTHSSCDLNGLWTCTSPLTSPSGQQTTRSPSRSFSQLRNGPFKTKFPSHPSRSR